MFRKATVTVLLVVSTVSTGLAWADDPNDCISQGRAYMFERTLSGLRRAYQAFDECMNDPSCSECNSDRKLKFLHALTGTAMLFIDNNDLAVTESFLDIAEAFGVRIVGDSLDPCEPSFVDVNVPLDIYECYLMPYGAPNAVEVGEMIDYSIIPKIDDIVAELDSISDSNDDRFRIFFEPNETGLQGDLEVDYAEVLILKGLLLAFKGQLEAQLAYDVFIDINEVPIDSLFYNDRICPNDINSFEPSDFIDINDPNNLSINEDFLTPYPDLLRVLPSPNYPDVNGTAILAQAAADVIASIDYCLRTLDYVILEDIPPGTDPQEDELIYIDPNDYLLVDAFYEKLITLRDSLANDTVGTYPLETAKRYDIYDSNSVRVGELVLVYSPLGIEGKAGSLDFTDSNFAPSPWEVEWFEIVEFNQVEIEVEHFSDGEWSGGFVEGTISADNNSIADATFEYWGSAWGTISGLSAQHISTEVLEGRLDINPLFGSSARYPEPVDLRDLLPQFDEDNGPISGTFGHGLNDNPTLGGIFPDMTQELWAILFELPVPGLRFYEELRLTVGDGPTSLALADLSGDGLLDIITANSWSDDVSVLFGLTDGSFQEQLRFGVGDEPESVVLADLNGDGILDGVVANAGSDEVSVLLGQTNAPPEQRRYAVGRRPMSVAVGDLNQDGIADIITANYWSDSVSVLLGMGDGDFQQQKTVEVGGGPIDVKLGDLNSDGKLDIITADDGVHTVSILLGLGDGNFQPKATFGVGYGPSSVELGDLNGDEILDVVTTNAWQDEISVLIGLGDGSFKTKSEFEVGDWQRHLSLGDVNGDGILDVVTANMWDETVSVLLGVGDGSFGRSSHFEVDGDPQSVALGDINGDGMLDIITANAHPSEVAILINRSEMYGHFPSGSAHGRVDAIRVYFPSEMDPCSFSVEDDVVGFTGPQGAIDITGYEWLSSRTLEIRFDPQSSGGVYQLTLGPEILDARGVAMDFDRDSIPGEVPDDQYVARFSLSGPRIIGQVPKGLTVGPIESLRLRFTRDMDQTSFSLVEDVVSFVGPGGSVTATGYNWVDLRTLEVSFEAGAPGQYEMVIGPNILDLLGNPMDQDSDFSLGEEPDDRYIARFEIVMPPRIISHDPNGMTTGPIQALRLSFDQAMDTGSFSLTEDIESFTGPQGTVQLQSFTWADAQTLELAFDTQVAPGTYEMVVGPHILSVPGVTMDQDGDSHTGEVPDDQYVATFELPVPSTIISHSPDAAARKLLESLQLSFNYVMDQSSFSIAEDIVSFSGPQGTIEPKGYSWLDSHTLEVTFDPLIVSGNYEMVVGPNIINLEGDALDIDGDFVPGEVRDDRYVATFNIPIDLPQTGQTATYVAGDDGDLQAGIGWPVPRFSNNEDGTITDHLIGLAWTENANIIGASTNWATTLDYVTKMNSGENENFGYTDWRMPNILELESLVDAGSSNPATWLMSQGFIQVPQGSSWSNLYWSSSGGGSYRKVLWFYDGHTLGTLMKYSGLLWPVRTSDLGAVQLPKTGAVQSDGQGDDGDLRMGVPWPEHRLVDHNDGTVTDNLTALMWMRDADTANGSMTWQEALDHVDSLNNQQYLGYEDWRLPNRKELLSLVDFAGFQPALPDNHPFINVAGPYSGGYWTSTTCGNSASYAWNISLTWGGDIEVYGKTSQLFVWPVRGKGVIGEPGIVWHTPRGEVRGSVDHMEFRFNVPMDASSFAIEDDVVGFEGPHGPVQAEGFSWPDDSTLAVTFALQSWTGTYRMVLGPNILDVQSNPMDQDNDGVGGESPDDQYTAAFIITPPKIVTQTSSVTATGTLSSVRFHFDRPMDQSSFSPTEDIVSFTGPSGDVPVTDHNWVSSDTLEITVETQTKAGTYEIVLGPGILDAVGNGITTHKATFDVTAPKILGHTPFDSTLPPVTAMRFDFDRPMDKGSFSLVHDVVAFTGPSGNVTATGYTWLNPNTLEVTFGSQWATGSYQMVIGPQILDEYGNAVDQDEDLVVGETPEDQYSASFVLAYSGTMAQDATWSPEHGPVVVDGPVTIQSGATLTIEAGTIVKFANSSAGIIVNGILKINGTPQKRVILTSFKDDTAGGDTNGDSAASSPYQGDWKGIAFCNTTEMSSLEGIEIRYSSEGACVGYWYAPPSGIARVRNAVLRNNRIAIVARVEYSEIDLKNCLLIDNNKALELRNTAWVTLGNCTVMGNGDTGRATYAVLTIENSIFSFNGRGFQGLNLLDDLIVRNSCFYGPDTQAMLNAVGEQVFRDNDNIATDPQFADRQAGNYELSAGSPAIDTGRGVGASATDILGRPRHDDSGMPNVGSGFPCFVDMGAYERQENTAAGDLAVTYVSGPNPEIVSVGDTFTIEWAISNVGTLDCNASWEDRIYLSNDPYISSEDLILGTYDHNGLLPSGSNYTREVNAVVPASTGPKYILVRANATNSLYEPVTINNVLSSPSVLAVDVPTLKVGTPQTRTVSAGRWYYYRFEAQPGRTVLFTLDSSTSGCQIYLRHSLPPTISDYDTTSEDSSGTTQEMRLLEPIEGTYYIGVYSQWYSANYTISADLTSLNIRRVSPDVVGNAGQATLKIKGDNFDPNTQVQLVGPGGTFDDQEYYQDSAMLFTTFDLAAVGATVGLYDVVVINPDAQTVTAYDAVTIEEGGTPDFTADLSMPGRCRPGRVINLTIDYTNPSRIDVNSPILTLDSGDAQCQWQLPGNDNWVTGPDFRVMALSSEGPPTILRPDQTETITIKLRVPFRPGSVTVKLFSVGATPIDGSYTPIDWAEFENDVRPDCTDCTDPNTWDQTFAKLRSQIGDTWGEYAQALRENANRWFKAGRRAYYVPELFAMEMAEAQALPTAFATGRVIDSLSEQPVAGALVALRDDIGTTFHSALTQLDGTFLMDSVTPGTYTLAVDGYLVEGDFQIEIAQDLFGIPVRVIRAAEVVGTVAGPSAEPIEGAWVTLSSSGTEPVGKFTDVEGHFAFTTVPDGSWELLVQAEGYVLPQPIALQIIGPGTRNADVVLVAGASISGLVRDTQGVPLEGADVAASVAGGTSAFAETDGNGYYTLRGLSAGDCHIVVSAEGYVSCSQDIQALDLDDVLENIDFSMQQGPPVVGQVTEAESGLPLEGVVLLFFCEDQFVTLAITDADGSFLTNECQSGQYSVEYSLQGYQGGQKSFLLPPGGLQEPLQLTLELEIVGQQSPAILRSGFATLSSDERTADLDEKDLHKLAQGWLQKSFCPTAASHLLHFILPLGPDTNKVPVPRIYHPYHRVSEWAKNASNCCVTFKMSKKKAEDQLKAQLALKVCSAGDLPTRLDPVATKPLLFYCGADCSETASCGNCLPHRGSFDLCMAFGTMNDAICHVVNIYPVKESEGAITVKVVTLYVYNDYYVFTREHCLQNPLAPWNCWAWRAQEAGYATAFRTCIEISDSFEYSIPKLPKSECDPDPNDNDEDEETTNVNTSISPEDKWGPAGGDAPNTPRGQQLHYIRPPDAAKVFDYRIEIWNKPEAPVPTQDATIYDVLDANVFELGTFEFTRVGFLKWDVPLPGGQAVDVRVDCRPEMNIAVDITGTFDPETGRIYWWFHCVDPMTGDYPEDPNAGFLPPYNPETGFEIGWMEFRVKPKEGLPIGTQLANQAFVQFDFWGPWGPAPKEGPWVNTIADPWDLYPSGQIDLRDVAVLANRWLWEGSEGSIPEDIVPDGIVNFKDFAAMTID